MSSNKNKNIPKNVAVHPLVLLSIVDHFNRVCQKNRNKRVVGVLLGEYNQNQLDVTNCYALPFEEDPRESHIWFVDHIFHEVMYNMFKKINAKEIVVGWYTTGQSPKDHDLEINHLFRKYMVENREPVVVIIDPEHSDPLALPTQAYICMQEINKDGQLIEQFSHVDSSIEAFEAEEVGVEHLLREIKEIRLNSLFNSLSDKLKGLKGMEQKMNIIKNYLHNITDSNLKPNQEIIYNLQNIFNLLPNLDQQLHHSFITKQNDNMLNIYQASLVKTIFSLHDLLDNKLMIKSKQAQSALDSKENNKI